MGIWRMGTRRMGERRQHHRPVSDPYDLVSGQLRTAASGVSHIETDIHVGPALRTIESGSSDIRSGWSQLSSASGRISDRNRRQTRSSIPDERLDRKSVV